MMSFLVKFGASVIFLVVLAYQVDLQGAFLRLGSLGLGTVAACLSLSLLQFTALGYRWNWVNRMLAMKLPLSEALRCTLASQFFSQGLPASIGGDALRIWWLSRLGSPMATAVQSVLLDRAAGLIALAALNLVAVANLLLLVKNAQSATSIAPVVIAAILLIAVGTSRTGGCNFNGECGASFIRGPVPAYCFWASPSTWPRFSFAMWSPPRQGYRSHSCSSLRSFPPSCC
jgi:uncharacterized membrane protein YbhN (UPF0104 family)